MTARCRAQVAWGEADFANGEPALARHGGTARERALASRARSGARELGTDTGAVGTGSSEASRRRTAATRDRRSPSRGIPRGRHVGVGDARSRRTRRSNGRNSGALVLGPAAVSSRCESRRLGFTTPGSTWRCRASRRRGRWGGATRPPRRAAPTIPRAPRSRRCALATGAGRAGSCRRRRCARA